MPIIQTHAKGDTILLMNNSNTPHTITAATENYSIGALHYKTLFLGQTEKSASVAMGMLRWQPSLCNNIRMFKNKSSHQRKVFLIAGSCVGVLVIVFIVAVATHRLRFQSPVVFLDQPQQVQSEQESIFNHFGQTINGLDANGNATGVAVADDAAYQDAIRLYDGKAMHFNNDCQASPASMILSGQSIVILENQSVVTRSMTVGMRQYTIAPQNFILVSFEKAGTYPVTCDSSQPVGYISVQ